MDIMHFKCHALNTHTHCLCVRNKTIAVCVLTDHFIIEAADTHSSLGVGLEKNSLYSWCSS